jgi:hypothetical protein
MLHFKGQISKNQLYPGARMTPKRETAGYLKDLTIRNLIQLSFFA